MNSSAWIVLIFISIIIVFAILATLDSTKRRKFLEADKKRCIQPGNIIVAYKDGNPFSDRIVYHILEIRTEYVKYKRQDIAVTFEGNDEKETYHCTLVDKIDDLYRDLREKGAKLEFEANK